MKALIFAAGLGTRLRPFTLSHPKALAPVQGQPMLQRVIEKLKAYGIDEMVVNTHHFAEQITDFLHANSDFGITIHISDESACLLDTGGGLLAARKWLQDDNFVVHNADILTDFDLKPMMAQHTQGRALATLLVAERPTSRYLLLDEEMRMRGWTNVKTGEVLPASLNADEWQPWAFGGVHVLSPEIFPLLQEYAKDAVFSIMPFYIHACRRHKIKGYAPERAYRWFDIGNPESLAMAERNLMEY